jgi:hypothetical protein
VVSTFDGGTSPLTFSGNSSSGLADQTFDLTGATGNFNADITAGYAITVNGTNSQFFVNGSGKLKLKGSENITINPSNPHIADGSTIVYNASSEGPYDLKDYAYYNLHIAGGNTVFNMVSNINAAGGITISAGTLNATANNYNINLEGDWNNTGTFNAQGGTVTFDGCNQSILGTTSFNDLAKTTASPCTWTFQAGTTTTVTGTWTATGIDSNNLSLRSSANGAASGILILRRQER